MKEDKYNIIGAFECVKRRMLIIRMNRAACIMTEEEYNKIIIAERKYRKLKNRKVA